MRPRCVGSPLNWREFPRETSPVADALTYSDITTSAVGGPFPVLERIADILRRYDESSIVSQAIRQAQPALAQVIERMQRDGLEGGGARDTAAVAHAMCWLLALEALHGNRRKRFLRETPACKTLVTSVAPRREGLLPCGAHPTSLDTQSVGLLSCHRSEGTKECPQVLRQ